VLSITLEILVCLLCVGGDLVRQNSITQQILAQYLQKRLNRAGGSVQQIGQPQLLLPTGGGNDLTASVVGINNNNIQKNVAENPYDGSPDDDDDIVGDARYYQGLNVCRLQRKSRFRRINIIIPLFNFLQYFSRVAITQNRRGIKTLFEIYPTNINNSVGRIF